LVQLWSLPLILVGTNILGRNAERRSQLDHEKLAKSYEEQQRTYNQVIAMLKKQEEMMTALLQQDKVLEAQNIVLAEQTEVLAEQTEILKKSSSD
jgi:molybdopterin converting factor small subunit